MLSASWQVDVTRPYLLLGLSVLPVLVYLFLTSLVDYGRIQRIVSLVARSVIVVLLVFALAGLALLRPATRHFVVLAVDESLSVEGQASHAAQEYAEQVRQAAKGRDQLAMLRFARGPGQIESVSPREITSTTDRAFATADQTGQRRTDRMGSNLATAIEVAAAAIPPSYVPHVVLLSDGNQTDGDAVRAALAAGVPVSTVPLSPRDAPEVQVSAVNVPVQVRQGEPFHIEVVIDSNHDDEGTIELFRGDVKIGDETATTTRIRKGQNRYRFPDQISEQRLVEYSVTISGFQDQLLDNNSASGLVSAEGEPRVLLIDGQQQEAMHLRWALEEQGIAVTVRPSTGVPTSLADLQDFDAILLSNVPAEALSRTQMDMIRTFVQDLGGGLIMLGGDQSFGLGGYNKTPLEEILPVWSDFEKEKEKPSLAMVLVIDKSGSMVGEKMELAKDAAKGAVELLGVRDQVGVIAFDSDSYWVSQLHDASDKNYLNQRISRIEAGGGTSMYPPMLKAHQALSSTKAKMKHVILMTDGISAEGDFDAATAQLVGDRVTVSTVGVGDEVDQDLLRRIAHQGNGRYYYCDDPQSVPQVFAKETLTVTKPSLNELPFLAQLVRPTPVLRQVDLELAPFLLGFVITRPKPTCELILATESGEPLLAWWRYGLGVTVAFTSDATSRWAAEWLSWPEFGTFWAQIVRHAMRKNEAKGVYVDVVRSGATTEVRMDVVDALGQFRNGADTTLSVIGPDRSGQTQPAPMQQTAPGRYVARFDTADSGTYHLEFAQRLGSQLAFRQTRGLVVGYPEELRLRPTNEGLLRKIAEVSGGQYDPTPADVFRVGSRSAHGVQPMWPYLLAAAVLVFCGDVALRRIDFSLLPPLLRNRKA